MTTQRIEPVWTKQNHPPTCHPDRNEMEWRDLLKWQSLPYAGNFCNLGRFLHSAFAPVGMTDVFCVGWYKFKCTTYMAADCRRYTRFVQRYTQCSGDDSSPSNVAIITRVAERYHPRHVIPTEMKWSGGIFPSSRFYFTQVISATWEDPSTPLALYTFEG